MTSVDGAILMELLINHLQITDVNIFQGQPSKFKGPEGVGSQRNKMPTILYKYRCGHFQKPKAGFRYYSGVELESKYF